MLRYDIRTGVKKIKTKTGLAISGLTLGLGGLGMAVAIPLVTHADSAGPITFEPSTYILANIDGQNGWSKTGPYDAAVSSNTSGFSSFGTQSLRISNAVTSGSFGDQTFAPAISQQAGESGAWDKNGNPVVSPQPHFESQFDIASTTGAYQPGLINSVSPDNGVGARMSYLRFESQSDGIHVHFDDATDPGHITGFEVVNFIPGPDNDVVKIFIDGTQRASGTSWEDYYRFDTESNPTLANVSRTVNTMLFRAGGTAAPGTNGNGYLIDNLSYSSGAIPVVAPTNFQVKPWTYDPGKTKKVGSAWVTHEGTKDAGGSDHALYLTKNTLTATNASGGATVTYSGQLNSLGFDYRNDGHCGAGAPRFNVYTSSGVYYFFGCSYGIHTPVPGNPGWTRVTFSNADAFPSDGSTAFPGFGNLTVTGIDVVFDEGTDQGQGFVYLDNIQVNSVYAGKPGLAQ
jgi:hypothetical protein